MSSNLSKVRTFWLLRHQPRKRAPLSTCSARCPRNFLDLHCVAAWLEGRTEVASSLGLVLVGEGPYDKTDVDHALNSEVLGDVPFDPDGVSALISASSRRRSPLLRHARSIAGAIREHFARGLPPQQLDLAELAAPPPPGTISAAVGIVQREESRS
jgi:hypothetical protein